MGAERLYDMGARTLKVVRFWLDNNNLVNKIDLMLFDLVSYHILIKKPDQMFTILQESKALYYKFDRNINKHFNFGIETLSSLELTGQS